MQMRLIELPQKTSAVLLLRLQFLNLKRPDTLMLSCKSVGVVFISPHQRSPWQQEPQNEGMVTT